MKPEKTVWKERKDKKRRRGGILVILYLLSFILYLVSCEQPSGNDGTVTQTENNDNNDNDDNDGNDDDDYDYEDPYVYVPQINAIAIKTFPNTTYFALNQPFTYAGLEVQFVYDNGEYGRTLAGNEYTVQEISTARALSRLVTVSSDTAEGRFTVKYGITIDRSESILMGLTMTKGPSKTDYALGEDFSTAGIEVQGVYTGGERNGEEKTLNAQELQAVAVAGYNKYQRGSQTVTFKLNGAVLGTVAVAVKVPAGATFTLNWDPFTTLHTHSGNMKILQFKGRAYDAAYSNITATVNAGNQKFILSAGTGAITDADLSGWNPAVSGNQTVTLDLDGNTKRFDVYAVDAGPEVWFDYGYRRTAQDPNGAGPGAGAYYAKQGETLVLSPVRFLLGYNDNHQDTGATYNWSVISGPSTYTLTTAPASSREFCSFTPSATGTYRIKVDVTGRGYVTGGTVTKSAETDVVCYTGNVGVPAGKTYRPPMKDFAPGQQNEGAGNGWSLGSALGYEVWSLPNGAAKLEIHGNPFSGWCEAGIVWVQYDANGNGIPDEMWYELRGGDDDDALYRNLITRRYAVRYIRAPFPAWYRWNGTRYVYDSSLDTEGIAWLDLLNDGSYSNKRRPVFWVDSKGRVGSMDGWPYGASLADEAGASATYSGTVLRDNGGIDGGIYNLPGYGYVDTGGNAKHLYATFNVARDAIRADDSAANLNPVLVRFVKVQTALFQYGNIYGNVSTEIVYGTNLADQSGGFPMPTGGYE